MKQALNKLEWQRCLALLSELEPISHQEAFQLVQDVIHSGALIQKRPGNSSQAIEFAETLGTTIERSRAKNAHALLQKHLSQKSLIERAYAALLNTLGQAAIRSHSPAEQVWGLLERLPAGMETVQRKLHENIEQSKKKSPNSPVSPNSMIADSAGNLVDADAVADSLMNTLFSTIHMLAYEAKWFRDGIIVLPPKPPMSEEIGFKAGAHTILAQYWAKLSDAEELLRFRGGNLTQSRIKETTESPEHDLLWFELTRNLEIYERVARDRFDQLGVGLSLPIQFLKEDSVMPVNLGKHLVPLTPEGHVSLDESHAAEILRRVYQFPLLDDEYRFGGLSPRQWLRGYAILQQCFARDANNENVLKLVTIDPSELTNLLQNGGLNKAEATVFIREATLQRGKRDLFDAPLILDSTGVLHFLAAGFASCSLPMVVASQIGSQEDGMEIKGTKFEDAVLNLLKSAGISAKGFTYTIDGKTYQCDAAFIWDRHLFVFECKTHLIPNGSPKHSFYFWESVQEDLTQCRRIADDLKTHPKILQKHFGENIQVEHVHAVLLNALPFSTPGPITGVYLYDFSALSRFITSPELTVTAPIIKNDGSRILVEHIIGSLWHDETPVPTDLIDAMTNPIQFKVNVGKWSIRQFSFAVSNELVIRMPVLHQGSATYEDMLRVQGFSEDQLAAFNKASSKIFEEFHKPEEESDES